MRQRTECPCSKSIEFILNVLNFGLFNRIRKYSSDFNMFLSKDILFQLDTQPNNVLLRMMMVLDSVVHCDNLSRTLSLIRDVINDENGFLRKIRD
jgi:hypothetical protein